MILSHTGLDGHKTQVQHKQECTHTQQKFRPACVFFGGHQAWVFMTKPDRALKMQWSSAGLPETTAKTQLYPSHSGWVLAHKRQEQHNHNHNHKYRLSAAYQAVLQLMILHSQARKSNASASRLIHGPSTTAVGLIHTLSKMCPAFIMYACFPIMSA